LKPEDHEWIDRAQEIANRIKDPDLSLTIGYLVGLAHRLDDRLEAKLRLIDSGGGE